MTTQPEALRLADDLAKHLGGNTATKAAAELRRLAEENELLRQRHRDDNVEYTRMLTQRDALLEALRTLLSYATTLEMRLLDADGEHRAMRIARAAIAKAEEA